jgi:hypothetical protein
MSGQNSPIARGGFVIHWTFVSVKFDLVSYETYSKKQCSQRQEKGNDNRSKQIGVSLISSKGSGLSMGFKGVIKGVRPEYGLASHRDSGKAAN